MGMGWERGERMEGEGRCLAGVMKGRGRDIQDRLRKAMKDERWVHHVRYLMEMRDAVHNELYRSHICISDSSSG